MLSPEPRIRTSRIRRYAVLLACVQLLAGGGTTARAQQLALRTFSSGDGVAGDDVAALLADSRGFLWIGTTTGLSRFDGTEFKRYGLQDGLPHLDVQALLEDRHGTLWVGTVAGLARIEPAANRMFPVDLGSATSSAITRLLQTRDGRVWIVAGGALYLVADEEDAGEIHKVEIPVPRGWENMLFVESLAEGTEGDLWIGTRAGLLRRLASGRFVPITVRLPSSNDRIFDLAVDAAGRLWITHWGLNHAKDVHFAVYVLAPHPSSRADADAAGPLQSRARPIVGGTTIPLPRNPGEIVYLTAGSPIGDVRVFGAIPIDDVVWLTTANGVVRIAGERVVRYDGRNGVGHPVQAIARTANVLWLGTGGVGLIRMIVDGLVSFGDAAGVPPGEVAAMFEDRTGTLCLMGSDVIGRRWFGAFGGDRLQLFQLRGTGQVRYWGWGWQQVYLQARDGDFWVATGDGLVRYPAARSCTAMAQMRPKASYGKADGLRSNEVFRLFEDSRGDLWLSSGQAVRWERATQTFHAIEGRRDGPSAFAEDRGGNIWVGFYGGGVGRVHGDRLHLFDDVPGVPSGFISTLFTDSRGRLWIGSDTGGLARVDDPTADRPRFVKVTAGDELSDIPVYAVIDDRAGQIYVATARGVLRLDDRSNVIRRYSSVDGLPGYTVRAAYRDRHGNLWFGTRRGLSRLTPQAEAGQPPRPAFIDRLSIGGVPQETGVMGRQTISGLVIQPANRQIEIGYGSPNLVPGVTPSYAVRLNDVESGWRAPTRQRTVTYPSLQPGSYKFEVRTVIDGRVSPVPAAVAFTIVPPLWERGWVRACAGLAFFVMVLGAYHLRVRRLVALNRVRARIATDLHDDLGARLSRISILSELAARRISTDPPAAVRLLGEVGETARSMLDAAADIAWSVDPRHDHVASLAARIRRFAGDMLDGRNMRWTFEVGSDAADAKLSLEQRRHVLLVFQEALTNVVRHSAARNVRLALRVEDRRLIGIVRDDGRGVNQPDRSVTAAGGNGLGNMAKRAREIGGTLAVESSPATGTEVRLTVPLR